MQKKYYVLQILFHSKGQVYENGRNVQMRIHACCEYHNRQGTPRISVIYKLGKHSTFGYNKMKLCA
jgi:hypothetical protein